MSTFAVYLFSSKKVNTKVPIRELKYVIQSMHSKEFLLQFSEGIDLRIGGVEDREQMLGMMKDIFKKENPNQGCRFYGIPNPTLKEFKSNQNKNNYDFEPDEKYRLKDEEI